MNQRKEKAKQMIAITGYASQFESNKFRVRSQTNPDSSYVVTKTENDLRCECKDHLCRKADCKHIKIILNVIMKNRRYKNNTFRTVERSNLKLYKYCDSGRITTKGTRKNKKRTVQIYKCLDCKKRFPANFGFEKKQFDYATIAGGLADVLFRNGCKRHFKSL